MAVDSSAAVAGHTSQATGPETDQTVAARPLLPSARRIVVKIGSTLVTNEGRGMDAGAIEKLAAQSEVPHDRGNNTTALSFRPRISDPFGFFEIQQCKLTLETRRDVQFDL